MEGTSDKQIGQSEQHLESALDQSTRELLMFATFYEGHGKWDQANEIYKLIRRIRDKRYRADVHTGGL